MRHGRVCIVSLLAVAYCAGEATGKHRAWLLPTAGCEKGQRNRMADSVCLPSRATMETPAESVSVTPVTSAKPKPNKRRARVAIDKRFAVGRRIKELTATFRERLGFDANPDPLLLTAIERAAQLQALAEQAAARALRADPKVAYDDVVRLSRLADHAVRRLRLDRNNTKQPSLSEYLAARGGVS
jgi:hypothetical protein